MIQGNWTNHFLIITAIFFSSYVNGQSIDRSFEAKIYGNPRVTAAAYQSDGKLILAGTFSVVGDHYSPGFARLNPDGSIDLDFNSPILTEGKLVSEIEVQPDGKIVLAGQFMIGGRKDMIRLNPNGSIDNTFTLSSSISDIFQFEIQPDGKFIVVGSSVSPVSRINADGSLDATFNAGSGPDGYGVRSGLFLQNDGKVYVYGGFSNFNGQPANRIVRLNADGSRDTNFQIGSGPQADFGIYADIASVNELADSKILIGGSFSVFNEFYSPGVVKLNQDGTIDESFTVPSSLDLVFPYGASDVLLEGDDILVSGITIESNAYFHSVYRLGKTGSINNEFKPASLQVPRDAAMIFNPRLLSNAGSWTIIGEFFRAGQTSRLGIARFSNNGDLDLGFAPFLGGQATIYSMIKLPDNRVLVAGDFEFVEKTPANKLALLNSDGSLDETFQQNLGVGIEDYNPTCLAMQSDGKIVVGGHFVRFNGSVVNGIVRLNPDGTRDNSLASPLFAKFVGLGVSVLKILPDGKILAGGTFNSNASHFNLVRLDTDGTEDPSFNYSLLPEDHYPTSIGVQSTGDLIIAGTISFSSGGFMMRTDASGNLIKTISEDVDLSNQTIRKILVQPDDGFICGGDFNQIFDSTAPNPVFQFDNLGNLKDNSAISVKNISIFDLLPFGESDIIVAGNFSSINNKLLDDLSKVSLSGVVDPEFNYSVDGEVRSVIRVRADRDVFLVGGSFTSINGSRFSNIAKIDLNTPRQPESLSAATDDGVGDVNLEWTDASDNEAGFQIWRAEIPGVFVLIDSVAANIVSYIDSSAEPLKEYAYVVTAFDSESYSDYSNEVQIDTHNFIKPIAPDNLSHAFSSDYTEVTISWRDNSLNELEFVVERSINEEPFESIGVTSRDATYFLDESISFDNSFRYRVKATNIFGDSDYSEELSIPVVTGAHGEIEPIQFYPNPTSDKIIIMNPGRVGLRKIEVMTAQGIALRGIESSSDSEIEVDVSSLAEGIYILTYKTSSDLIVAKFIKINLIR